MRVELVDLIRLSRQVGADPDWVQGGGGNTSVKTSDGRTMFVKASGTSLVEMTETTGWAELDLRAALALLLTPGLAELPAREREERVLALLRATARRPAGVRPSVEACLHALLDRVVIHSHPVQLTAFLCARESPSRWPEMLGDLANAAMPALYVPYVDPGYTLASRLAKEIAAYEDAHGQRPQIVLLENHGLFVAAATADDCLELHERVADAGRRFTGRERVNPRPDATANDADANDLLALRVRGALLRGGAQACLVQRDRTAIAAEYVASAAALPTAQGGTFTPDLIVYCRTWPVVLSDDDPRRWERAVATYREQHGLDPRVAFLPGRAIFHTGTDTSQLRVVAETHRLGMAALLCSDSAGGPRLLDRAQAGFIEEWEVEKFRAALVQGAARPLAGRVAVVLDRGTGIGRKLARVLQGAGATTRELVGETSPATPNGLDFVVDVSRVLAPASSPARSLLERFQEQSAGGHIVLLDAEAADVNTLEARARALGVRVRALSSHGDVGAALIALLSAGR